MAEEKKSNRDRFRERYAKRYPDVNMDDEEAYYDRANSLMDEYEGYENNSRQMREQLAKSPAFAEMMVAARGQEDFDPVVWMVQNRGLDLQALQDDPDYAKKLADAHNSYLEKRAKQDDIEKQMEVNMPQSIEGIRAKAGEMGMTDEQAQEVVGRMYQVMDDLIVGKLDPSIFEMMAKGMNYNNAVATARAEGEAEGLSRKVDDKLRDLSQQASPSRGRQRARQEPPARQEVNNPFMA